MNFNRQSMTRQQLAQLRRELRAQQRDGMARKAEALSRAERKESWEDIKAACRPLR